MGEEPVNDVRPRASDRNPLVRQLADGGLVVSTLYSPVDAFSTKLLETTANGAIGAGDSTVDVPSTMGGFAATYGILSIDDPV
jgi:hypothetical protein